MTSTREVNHADGSLRKIKVNENGISVMKPMDDKFPMQLSNKGHAIRYNCALSFFYQSNSSLPAIATLNSNASLNAETTRGTPANSPTNIEF